VRTVTRDNQQEFEFLTDRIIGCLVGGAIGDALGAPIEFDSWETIEAKYGPSGVTGFNEAYGRVGAVTDDTQTVEFLDEMEGLSCNAATEFHGEPPTDHDESREGMADWESWWENYPGW